MDERKRICWVPVHHDVTLSAQINLDAWNTLQRKAFDSSDGNLSAIDMIQDSLDRLLGVGNVRVGGG